jgi:hypothetical protein
VIGDAIKAIAACALSGVPPTVAEQGAALAEGVDLLLDFFADIHRIADASERVEIKGRDELDALNF